MQGDAFHFCYKALRYASIPFTFVNAGEIFFFALISFSTSLITPSRYGVIRCTAENCTSRVRTNCLSDAVTIADREKPSSSASSCACLLTFLSVLILIIAVFIPEVYTLGISCQYLPSARP